MGFWQGSSLFWDCDAACVVQAHENCSAGGLVSTPASASFAYFASCCTHCLVQSVAIFMGVFAGLCQREHFIEPWVHHHNDTYTYDLVSPEVADFAGTVATSLFDCTTGIISAVITMAMSLLCILWTWECMLLPLVVFGCYLVVCSPYSRPATNFSGLRMRRLLARRARDTGDPRALRGLRLMADGGAFNACVVNAFASNSKDFHLTGLRLKSPAHLKDFLERADEALVIAHSIAGVRNKLVDIR